MAYRTTRRSHVQTTRRAVTTPRPTTRRTTRRTTTQPWRTTPTTRRTTTRPWTTTSRTTTRPWTTTPRTTTRSTTQRTTTRPWTTTPRTTTRTTTRWTPPPITTTKSTTRRTTTQPWWTTTAKSTTRRTTTQPWWTTTKSTTRRTTTQPWWATTPRSTSRTARTTSKIRTSTMSSYDALPRIPGSGKRGKTDIKIVNKHTVVFPGYYPIPVEHPQYPGYLQTVTSYRYAPKDTGNTVLGFYLGYKLGQLTTPTYSHEKFYNGYTPRYDHYVVHHYYHNSASIPKQQEISSKTIVGCAGDSSTVCPANTTSFCTSDGKLMCVVTVAALADCTDANNQRVKCVKSTILCANNSAQECKGSTKGSVTVDIPCVSMAKIEGHIRYVNTTIVKGSPPAQHHTDNCTRSTVSCVNTTGTDNIQTSNCTTVTISCGNTTSNQTRNCTITTVSCVNTVGSTNQTSNCRTSTVSCVNSTTPECARIMNTSCVPANITQSANNHTTSAISTTEVPITTTPSSVHWIWKRSVPAQDFCVTVLAVPAKRVSTPGEEFFNDAADIFKMFVEKAWNL